MVGLGGIAVKLISRNRSGNRVAYTMLASLSARMGIETDPSDASTARYPRQCLPSGQSAPSILQIPDRQDEHQSPYSATQHRTACAHQVDWQLPPCPCMAGASKKASGSQCIQPLRAVFREAIAGLQRASHQPVQTTQPDVWFLLSL